MAALTGGARIVLIRHGESAAQAERRISRRETCTGLSERGRQQVALLARRLERTGEADAAMLVTSPYQRAVETARGLAAVWAGIAPTVDEAFGERDPGASMDGRPDTHGSAIPDTATGFAGGETLDDLFSRVGSGLRRLEARAEGRTVVVVTHVGVIDAVLRLALGCPSSGSFQSWADNTSLTEIRALAPGFFALERFNDVAHLAGHGLGPDRPAGPIV